MGIAEFENIHDMNLARIHASPSMVKVYKLDCWLAVYPQPARSRNNQIYNKNINVRQEKKLCHIRWLYFDDVVVGGSGGGGVFHSLPTLAPNTYREWRKKKECICDLHM